MYPWIHRALICEQNRWDVLKRNQYTTCTALVVVNISATFIGDISMAQLAASVSGVVLGGVGLNNILFVVLLTYYGIYIHTIFLGFDGKR